ncbi:MAG TPA: zinc ribbon domain-containing protein [Pyrinomonadaceae bacterium]|nr:zinc ribbon domain-containing protein [Pyrinomonadaceae bacterium]
MSQVIKCQNCGTYVPAEKAFCPNCSEPMEMEQKSDRSHSFSSDMMSTIRDDPEKYREMLLKTPAKKQQQQQPPQPQQQQQPAAPAPPPVQVHTPPAMDRNVGRPAAAATAAAAPAVPTAAPAPVAQTGGKRNLILGISAVALLAIVIVLLFVFKVI